jgi:hypothetical protein
MLYLAACVVPGAGHPARLSAATGIEIYLKPVRDQVGVLAQDFLEARFLELLQAWELLQALELVQAKDLELLQAWESLQVLDLLQAKDLELLQALGQILLLSRVLKVQDFQLMPVKVLKPLETSRSLLKTHR